MYKNLKSDIRLFQVFYAVAKTKSISKASELLYISQPAVSYHIKMLEEKLNNKLFYRTTQGVVLTPMGESIFPYVEAGYKSFLLGEDAIDELSNLSSGKLTIGAPGHICMFCLTKVVKDFNSIYPNIQINLQNKSTLGLINLANSCSVDLFIDSMPVTTNSKNIKIEHYSNEECCFICHKEYYEKNNVTNNIDDLNNYDLILPENGSNNRNIIDNYFISHNIILKPKFQITTTEVMQWFVKNKMGIGFFYKKSVQDLIDSGEYVELQFKTPLPQIELVVGYNKNGMTEVSKKFLNFLKNSNH